MAGVWLAGCCVSPCAAPSPLCVPAVGERSVPLGSLQTGWGLAGAWLAAVLIGTLVSPSPLGGPGPGAVLPLSVILQRSDKSSFYCYHY